MLTKLMKKLLLAVVAFAALSGCVTQDAETGEEVQGFDSVSAARTRMSLGLTYLEIGDTEQAKFNLERALEYAPRNPEVHRSMAYYFQTVGEFAQAERSYRQALSLDRHDADTMNNFGVFLCERGRYAEAEQQFMQAVKQPTYFRIANTYENAGSCALKDGKLDLSITHFETALTYEANRGNSLLGMAEAYFLQKKYFEARGQLVQYQRLGQDSPQSLMLWIQVERAVDNPDAADRFAKRLLSQFPESPQAHQILTNDRAFQ